MPQAQAPQAQHAQVPRTGQSDEISTVNISITTTGQAAITTNNITVQIGSTRTTTAGLELTQLMNSLMDDDFTTSTARQPAATASDAAPQTRRPRSRGAGKTPEQQAILEAAFASSELLGAERRDRLALATGLTKTQVQDWFKNTKAKNRRAAAAARGASSTAAAPAVGSEVPAIAPAIAPVAPAE